MAVILKGEKMAVRTVNRNVSVTVCDECGTENEYLDQCGICRTDKCNIHMAYAFADLFRYSDHARIGGRNRHICKECARNRKDGIHLGHFLDLILAK